MPGPDCPTQTLLRVLRLFSPPVLAGLLLLCPPPPVAAGQSEALAFRNCDPRLLPPKEVYQGPLYVLSHAYPQLPPTPAPATWKAYSPLTEHSVDAFLLELRAHVYSALLRVDWRPTSETGWYAMPWITMSEHPLANRECIRGMYGGNTQPPYTFSPQQTEPARSFATELYNESGGYAIEKIWRTPDRADLDQMKFPEGTIVVKLSMVSAPLEQVPMLEGAPAWRIYTLADDDARQPELQTVRVMQLDIVLKDHALAPQTGWVFGTLVYDADAEPTGWNVDDPATMGWYKLVPAGVSWGNDPGVTQEDVARGARLAQTVISPRIPNYARRLLGYAGRLSGPVDAGGKVSSCISCHSLAQTILRPGFNQLLPPHGASRVVPPIRWFRNLAGDMPFEGPEGGTALDYDFVLYKAIQGSRIAQGVSPEALGLEVFGRH